MKTCVVNAKHSLIPKNFLKNGADIYRCNDCGCIMADIDFDHGQYESGDYYTLAHKSLEDINNEWGFRWRYILGKIVRNSQASTLLDVGAGNGYFVSLAAKEFGLNANGLEISAEEIRFAKDVLNVHLIHEDVTRHRRDYDVVTSFNVLEHVPDPQSFLTALVDRIKPGGLLVLTTPNPGCIHAKIHGVERWSMVDPPHHINLFSRKSLVEILETRGMELVDYETVSTYINFVRKIDTNSLVLRRLFFNLLRIANLGADHFVIARKRAG